MKLLFSIIGVILLNSVTSTPIQRHTLEIADECTFSLETKQNPPVITTPALQPLYPDPLNSNRITIPANATILISCVQSTFTANPYRNTNTLTATCLAGDEFHAGDATLQFASLDCVALPAHSARYANRPCEGGGEALEIGFQLAAAQFAAHIALCFDQQRRNALYSSYNLTRAIAAHETGVARPTFAEAIFYNLTERVDKLYSRATQRATINGLLGLAAASTKYVQDNDYFLSRGHLTAKADFVYAGQQTSTFYFVNAAPQWQTFNGNGWNDVEVSTRDLAEARAVDLRVWTGTYGVATLPHEETGEEVELWLFEDASGKAIAVPELYWKVVYEPVSKRGVAIFGLNNPYQRDVTTSVICKDVSEQVAWVKWEKDNAKGYSYACEVDGLRAKIDYLPKFDVSGLLV